MTHILNHIRFYFRHFRLDIAIFFYRMFYARNNVQKLFAGKRVAIVGPAQTMAGSGYGNFIDGFDVIIRMNNGPKLLAIPENLKDLGSRTDILFHNLDETKEHERLEFDLYKIQHLKHLVSYLIIQSDRAGQNVWILRFLQKYRTKIDNKLIVIPKSIFRKLYKELYPKNPTTGMVAIYTVVHSNFSELFICGFTFFKTKYISKYTVASRTEGESDQAWIDKKNIEANCYHDPEGEIRLFKKLISLKPGMIQLDPFLKKLI